MTSENPIVDPAARPRRRTFSPEYKLRVVAEYDAAEAPSERGAILRRERLYHSHVQEWRQARDVGALEKLVDRRTSPARPRKSADAVENERLHRKVARLEKEVEKRDAALEVLGKAHRLLEMISESEG